MEPKSPFGPPTPENSHGPATPLERPSWYGPFLNLLDELGDSEEAAGRLGVAHDLVLRARENDYLFGVGFRKAEDAYRQRRARELDREGRERLARQRAMDSPFFPVVCRSAAPQPWYDAYLMARAITGSHYKSCQAIQKDASWVYECIRRDAALREAVAQAEAMYKDSLEQSAVERAVRGVERVRTTARGEPVMDPRDPEGKTVLVDKAYSDPLLLALLRGAFPEKYRAHEDGAPSQQVQVNVNLNSPQVQEALKKIRASVVPSSSSGVPSSSSGVPEEGTPPQTPAPENKPGESSPQDHKGP